MKKLIIFILLFTGVVTASTFKNSFTIGKDFTGDISLWFSNKGSIKYNDTDDKLQFSHNGTDFQNIGSGGGGVNYFPGGDADAGKASDWTTGNSAVFGASGTVSGTFVQSSTAGDLIDHDGKKVWKYTQASGSLNDWLMSPVITLPRLVDQQGLTIAYSKLYQYDGDDDDISVRVLCSTDSSILLGPNDDSGLYKDSTKATGAVNVPSSCLAIKFGIQVTALNDTKILLFDDIQINSDPFVYKNLINSQYIHYDGHAGFGSTNTMVPYFTNPRTNKGENLLTVTNDSANGFQITANRNNVNVTIHYSAKKATAGGAHGLSINSTQLSSTINSITDANRIAIDIDDVNRGGVASASVTLNSGEFINPHTDSGAMGSVAFHSITIVAFAEAEHVIHATTNSGVDSIISLREPNGTGSTNIRVRRFKDIVENKGSALTLTQSATLGDFVTVNELGLYTITYNDEFDAGNSLGVSKNSTELSTNIATINKIHRLCMATASAGSDAESCSITVTLVKGDVIRAHTSASTAGQGKQAHFSISKHASAPFVVVPLSETATMKGWTDYPLVIGAVTTAPTYGTVLANKASWRRVGDTMEIQFNFRQNTAGTAGSGTYLFPLPSGYTLDSSKMETTANNEVVVGHGVVSNKVAGLGSASRIITVNPHTSTALSVSNHDATSTFAKVGSGAIAMSEAQWMISFTARVPITGWSMGTGVVIGKFAKVLVGYLEDRKTSGTTGGQNSGDNSIFQRTLNNSYGDFSIFGTLTSNKFTLEKGTYDIEISCPAYNVVLHQCFLYQGGTNIKDGQSATTGVLGGDTGSRSKVFHTVTITVSTEYEVKHWMNQSRTHGFGKFANGTANPQNWEIYTTVKITKRL